MNHMNRTEEDLSFCHVYKFSAMNNCIVTSLKSSWAYHVFLWTWSHMCAAEVQVVVLMQGRGVLVLGSLTAQAPLLLYDPRPLLLVQAVSSLLEFQASRQGLQAVNFVHIDLARCLLLAHNAQLSLGGGSSCLQICTPHVWPGVLLKVVANLGLCVSVYDILAVEDGFIFPGQGCSTYKVPMCICPRSWVP